MLTPDQVRLRLEKMRAYEVTAQHSVTTYTVAELLDFLTELLPDLVTLAEENTRLRRDLARSQASRGMPYDVNHIRHRDGDMPALGSNGIPYERHVLDQVGRD